MAELNFDTCAGIVITADSIGTLFTTMSFEDVDPDATFYSETITDFISTGDDGTSYEADDALEGQEVANA